MTGDFEKAIVERDKALAELAKAQAELRDAVNETKDPYSYLARLTGRSRMEVKTYLFPLMYGARAGGFYGRQNSHSKTAPPDTRP